MLDLKEVYVPIDFSRSSRAASMLALELANRSGGQVRFVHGFPFLMRYARDTLFPYAAMGEDHVQILSELCDNAYRGLVRYHDLGELVPGVGKRGNGPPDGHSLEIFTAGQDVSTAGVLSSRLAESDASLVVAGLSNENDVLPGALGSSALNLVCTSTRPVLLVRDAPRDSIKKVCVGLDLSPHSQSVLQAAVNFVLAYEAEIEIVVVVPEPLAVDVRGILSSAAKIDHKNFQRHAQREVSKVLERFIGELEVSFPFKDQYEDLKIKRNVIIGDPAEKIVAHVEETDSQLLILGTHGERRAQLARRLGRVAHAAGANSSSNVLYIP